jgi:hypothetical protein
MAVVLHRLRNLVRRWPRLALALALGSFAGQGVAGTLSWCLHGSAEPHVVAAVEPCHDQAPQPRHCHGDDAAAPHHATHVSAASNGLLGALPAVPALPLARTWYSILPEPSLPTGHAGPVHAWRGGAPPGAARPRLAGALPGISSRLLI